MNENMRQMMPVKVEPFDHQVRAFAFAADQFGIFDGKIKSRGVSFLMEMGCGKTGAAIAVSASLFQFGRISRVLVVAPLSILGVWQEEYETFCDVPYSLTVLAGSTAKKKEQLKKLPGDGMVIVVVNYESAWRMEKELAAFAPDLIICDEAHKLKEGRTRQSKAMHNLGDHAKYKLLLTGTVITNKELDVFSQYRFLNPQIFGTSFYTFRNRYFDMKGYGNHTPVFREWMGSEFLEKLHSIAFRTTKQECLDLPPVTEEIRHVDLEPDALKLYGQIEEESYAQLDDSEITAANILTRLLRLSQITGGHLTDDDGNTATVSRAKLDALSDLIDSAMADDKKVVVMARFVPELDDIQELLEKKKIQYSVVRGGIKDRDNQVRRFQYDDNCRVFVGQIAASGLGITLHASSLMVFYSMDYSMANFEQAKARIHRAGQTERCHYVYLAARHTVDGKVLKSLRHKTDLARVLIDEFRSGKNPFHG